MGLIRWLRTLKVLFRPCFGFYLLGSVKQIAIANSFVSVSSMVIFGAGIYEFIPRRDSKQVADDDLQERIRPIFWLLYYVYWISEIYLSLYIYMAADRRDQGKCLRWLKHEIMLFIAFLTQYCAHTFWLHGFNPILEACFGVICVYKVYTFWVVKCFIRETIEINKKYKFISDLPDEDVEDFLKGYPVGKRDSLSLNGSHPVQQKPYDGNYEIAAEMIEKINEIGSGEFGTVFKAMYRIHLNTAKTTALSIPLPQGSRTHSRRNSGESIIVAVKCVKSTADISYFKALLAELKIMMYIGQHPNIVNLIGACTTNIKERKLDLVVEYCPYKSLDLHLQSRKGLFVNQLDTMGFISVAPQQQEAQDFSVEIMESVSTEDLVRWSLDTAKGMEYLYARNVIHGDLAARNVLLGQDKRAKISDFGLSRRIYSYKKRYVTSNQKQLPWRWMAPESLNHHLNFYLESDIWSYGVTIWEFFSLGDMPYAHLNYTPDFRTQLQNDTMKLGLPLYAPISVYALMLNCWKVERSQRLSYRSIISSLESILHEFRSPAPACTSTPRNVNSASSLSPPTLTISETHTSPNQEFTNPKEFYAGTSYVEIKGVKAGNCDSIAEEKTGRDELRPQPGFGVANNDRKISESSCTFSENYVMTTVNNPGEYV